MIYDFRERLAFSEGIVGLGGLFDHLLESIPAATGFRQHDLGRDDGGTDYWIDRGHGLPSISVDLKNRSFCPIARSGQDDAAIETCSVYEGPWLRPPYRPAPWSDQHRRKPGWSINPAKRTDLVVYTWPAAGAKRRFWVLWFPHLCQAALRNWRVWTAAYGEVPTRNAGYLTLNVYVPRAVIAGAMRHLITGAA